MKREYRASQNISPEDKKKILNELKLGYLNLSDGAFEQAKLCFTIALQYDSRCADAYWGLMLVKFQIKNEDILESEPLTYKSATSLPECQKALEFAEEKQLAQFEGLLERIVKINQGDNY